MPKVSVVMATHNCAAFLDQSISSVLDQSYGDIELVIVDDGSTDNTKAVIGKYVGDKRCKYIKIFRRGVSAARNEGIRISRGEFIAFLDADDFFLQNKISKQAALFEKKKYCGASYTNELYFKEGQEKEIRSTYYHFSGDIFFYLKRNDFIHTSTFMARREILEENMFDESLTSHEDWELFLRLARKGILFAYTNEPLTKVRVRQGSATRNTGVMDSTRREVGLKARDRWHDMKKEDRARYLKLKTKAFFMGFPNRKCFNRPIPQEVL